MKYRALGKTGLSVSEIGFGAWGIGGWMWKDSDDAESLRALHTAVDNGVNFIDTALVYGDGHSEWLVGKLLKDRKERIYVSTKIPPANRRWPASPHIPAAEAFPRKHIIESTERSLRNLGVDVIDLQQFHVWHDNWLRESEWWETILELKEQGKIQFFGVSINDHAPETALELVRSGKADTIQVIYNIFDQSPEVELFPLCIEKNVGVIVRVPLDEGGLTGAITPETTFPEHDWRNNYFRGERKREVYERVGKLKTLLGEEAQTLPELALRFCLSHKAVSTVIVGMRKSGHASANATVSDGRTLSPQLLAELKKHQWRRNFYSD
ncbi:MAG: aldo/keto reductase [Bacteroidota bacterium]